MLFCRCGCVTKLCTFCLAGSLATKLKNFNFIVEWVSEVTLGLLLLRFGHEIRCCFAVANASQSHATRALQARWLQNWKVSFLKSGFRSDVRPFFGLLLLRFGTKLDAVLPLRMRHKAMQLVLGRLAGNKSEKFQFYQSFNQRFNFISIL